MTSSSISSAIDNNHDAPKSEVFRAADGITIKIFNLDDTEKISREALLDARLIRSIIIETENPDHDEDDDDDEDIDIQMIQGMMGGIDVAGAANASPAGDDTSIKSKGSQASLTEDPLEGEDDNQEAEDEDEDEDDSDDESGDNEALEKACLPIVELLDAIYSAGGKLETFHWDIRHQFWDNSKVRRPSSFFTALWKHAPTLSKLGIGFYTHELHGVSGPTTSFPALKELYVDASGAHGDDGSAVEDLLKSCPALEILKFYWPGCDLDSCQIQDISWTFEMPKLRYLTLYGYDFAPQALASFLERHPSIENFVDGVDAESRVSFKESEGPRLSKTALPNVKAVDRASDSARYPEDWFDDEAGRKIAYLVVPWGWQGQVDVSKNMATELKCLDINASNVTAWRPDEADSDDDEEEKKRKAADPEKKLVKGVRKLLLSLTGLRELGVSLESQRVTMRLPDGTHGSPPGMDETDLKVVLSVLPKETGIRALRVWDTAGKPLSQELLDDFPEVPRSLEYLSWEGEEKVLYQFMRRGSGRVKAVLCEETLREVDEKKKGDWTEKRILDY
jgi:hypothetical protein